MPIQDKAKARCGAGKESEIQCLRESCKGEPEAKAEQGRPMTEKGRGGRSKPSGRAGLEQVSDRAGTG